MYGKPVPPLLPLVEAVEVMVADDDIILEEFARGVELLMEDFNNVIRNYIGANAPGNGSPREDRFIQRALDDVMIKFGEVLVEIRRLECHEATKDQLRTLIGEYVLIAQRIVSLPSYERLREYLNDIHDE